jgi:hypothetical protein
MKIYVAAAKEFRKNERQGEYQFITELMVFRVSRPSPLDC